VGGNGTVERGTVFSHLTPWGERLLLGLSAERGENRTLMGDPQLAQARDQNVQGGEGGLLLQEYNDYLINLLIPKHLHGKKVEMTNIIKQAIARIKKGNIYEKKEGGCIQHSGGTPGKLISGGLRIKSQMGG